MPSPKKTLDITAIIPAAGPPSNMIRSHTGLPDTMLPINGKAVIGHILDDLTERGIRRAIIAIRKGDAQTRRYVELKYRDRLEVTFVVVPKRAGGGIVRTIALAAKHVPATGGALVYLGDTIYKGPLSFARSFLVVERDIENPSKWCMAEKRGEKLAFVDKPVAYAGKGAALCGLYHFASAKRLLRALASPAHEQLSDVLSAYQRGDAFALVPAKRWYDCGNIENYHRARIDFLKLRNFNGLDYDPVRGAITKRSAKTQKIMDEARWYRELPDDLRIFAPRLLGASAGPREASYELEFYGYPSLADLYTFGDEDLLLWDLVIKRLLDIHALFRAHHQRVPLASYRAMYVDKVIERLEELRAQPGWKALLDYPELVINGRAYRNLKPLLGELPRLARKLHAESEDDMAVIHGDLCLGNILCDTNSLLFKFIDPRGSFGAPGVHGDQKYDLAKLRHSFHGNYDFIIADLFTLAGTGPSFSFAVHVEEKHREIARRFDAALAGRGHDVANISLIEGLLFLSMIPLHAESPVRQRAMYLTAVMTLQPYLDAS